MFSLSVLAANCILEAGCPGDVAECSDRGICKFGVCQCYNGFSGEKCDLLSSGIENLILRTFWSLQYFQNVLWTVPVEKVILPEFLFR